jgi:hypothetical protein
MLLVHIPIQGYLSRMTVRWVGSELSYDGISNLWYR